MCLQWLNHSKLIHTQNVNVPYVNERTSEAFIVVFLIHTQNVNVPMKEHVKPYCWFSVWFQF